MLDELLEACLGCTGADADADSAEHEELLLNVVAAITNITFHLCQDVTKVIVCSIVIFSPL